MKTIVGAALGECAHVAGVLNFLGLAEQAGWETEFLGPTVPIPRIVKAAERCNAQIVAVSYRLTPETGEARIADLAEAADELRERGVRFIFGGTPAVAERARAFGFFERVFDGSDTMEEILAFLRGVNSGTDELVSYPQTLLDRIAWKAPYPLLRHHFGLPSMEATLEGIAEICQARVLDVISLGIDQDAQENLFHPERQDPSRRGAGGVPVRSAEDYHKLYDASRQGNYPLMRTYTGTDDLRALAGMYLETINIAWPAIPIYWFNKMDGRGPWPLQESIEQHLELMRWYAARGIPVEVNEPHHWGLRDAPDVVFVAAAYVSAYVARACGVQDYIAQMMWNCPPMLADSMDLAKMLASLDLVSELENESFRVWRQTRTGLLSYPQDPDAAKGHLAASIYLQMALKPHIVHVVGHTEALHAAEAQDVIQACRMATRVVGNALRGQPDPTLDPRVQARREELVSEASVLIRAIQALADDTVSDPLADAATLAKAVSVGLLDAPHLRGNLYAKGEIRMRMDERGACVAVDPSTGRDITESERLQNLVIVPNA